MGSSALTFFMKKLLAVLITDRGWLSSWATPVAISPRVAILLAWISCCSASSCVGDVAGGDQQHLPAGYSERDTRMLTISAPSGVELAHLVELLTADQCAADCRRPSSSWNRSKEGGADQLR
jgi:hypothetical protein